MIECTAQPAYVAGGAVYPATNPQLRKALQSIFTLVNNATGEPVRLWEMSPDGKWIKVPRAACPPPKEGTDKRALGAPINLKCSVNPRPGEQAKFIQEASDLLLAGESFVARAPTGFGKTVMACKLISVVGRKTLVIVPKMDLMDSWSQALQEFLGLDKSDIGTIRQGTYDVEGKPVVLGMLHSLSKKGKYPGLMVKEFGMVIWDECHRTPADQFLPTAGLFHSKLRLGLSATPERYDGMNAINEAHIGPTRVTANVIPEKPLVFMWPTGWDICYPGKDTRIPHTPGKLGHLLKFMGKNRQRNGIVVHFLKKAHAKGRRTVVFADHLAHLEAIHAIAVAEGVPVEDIGYYIGGMNQKKLKISADKPVILATYGMMAEGTNIPWLDTAIFASPRSNIEQTIGRICRTHKGKGQPVAIDLVDEKSNILMNYAKKRIGIYQKLKADLDIRVG